MFSVELRKMKWSNIKLYCVIQDTHPSYGADGVLDALLDLGEKKKKEC